MEPLAIAIVVVGAGQALLVPANLVLIRHFGWQRDLERVDPLLREIVHIHCWYMGITLAIFAALSVVFAAELASGASALHRAICAALALFWGLRLLLQWVWYSPAHWRGHRGRTVAQLALTLIFASWTATYALAALGRSP